MLWLLYTIWTNTRSVTACLVSSSSLFPVVFCLQSLFSFGLGHAIPEFIWFSIHGINDLISCNSAFLRQCLFSVVALNSQKKGTHSYVPILEYWNMKAFSYFTAIWFIYLFFHFFCSFVLADNKYRYSFYIETMCNECNINGHNKNRLMRNTFASTNIMLTFIIKTMFALHFH